MSKDSIEKKKKVDKNTIKDETKGKKINLIITIVIIILALIVIGLILVKNFMFVDDKEKKAREAFGEEKCNVVLHLATKDLAPHTCKICGTEFQDSSMHADICSNCAEATNRCDFCGKKLDDNIKKQRENIK